MRAIGLTFERSADLAMRIAELTDTQSASLRIMHLDTLLRCQIHRPRDQLDRVIPSAGCGLEDD